MGIEPINYQDICKFRQRYDALLVTHTDLHAQIVATEKSVASLNLKARREELDA